MTGRSGIRWRAFTLVEVVVGLALAVMLLLVIESLTTGAYRVANLLETRAAERVRRRLPFQILADDLHNLPVGGGLELSNGVLAVRTLNALHSARATSRHAVDVRYRMQPLQSGANCWVRAEREPDQSDTANVRVAIAAPLLAIEAAVYDGQRWHTRWPLQMPRPACALRLRITWSAGEPDEHIVRLAPLRWRRHDE